MFECETATSIAGMNCADFYNQFSMFFFCSQKTKNAERKMKAHRGEKKHDTKMKKYEQCWGMNKKKNGKPTCCSSTHTHTVFFCCLFFSFSV